MSPAASAATAGAYGCAGSQISSYPETPNGGASGTIYGHIYLYHDSSTGQNCAVSVATATGGYGTLTTKKAYIARCVAGTAPGSTCTNIDVFAYDPPSGGNTPFTRNTLAPSAYRRRTGALLCTGAPPRQTEATGITKAKPFTAYSRIQGGPHVGPAGGEGPLVENFWCAAADAGQQMARTAGGADHLVLPVGSHQAGAGASRTHRHRDGSAVTGIQQFVKNAGQVRRTVRRPEPPPRTQEVRRAACRAGRIRDRGTARPVHRQRTAPGRQTHPRTARGADRTRHALVTEIR